MSAFQVCPRCEGYGTHDNENFNGFTAADRDEDFSDLYSSGAYSVPCTACKGVRVVTRAQVKAWEERMAYEAESAAEMSYMRG